MGNIERYCYANDEGDREDRMISVRPVDASLFDQVHPLLQDLDPSIDQSTWQRLFDYQWKQEEAYCGYGLFDDEKLVGFLGLIFSQRIIAQKLERFCNLTTWIVQPSYRGYSLLLMRSVMQLKNYTLTDFSSYKEVIQLSKRLGFQELDVRVKLLLASRFVPSFFRHEKIQCFQELDEIKTRLRGADATLFADHQRYPNCRHLLVCGGEQYCYLIFTVVQNSTFSYCYLHFISDVKLFAMFSLTIRAQLVKMSGTALILVDSRLVSQISLPLTYELPLNLPKLYKSDTLTPEQIDNLYSELILLNLNILPRNWDELVQKLRDRVGI
jgi:hypothetical protein